MVLTGNEDISEELTQETFFRAVKNSDKFDGSVKVTTWLCAIAKNAYFSYLKKAKRNIDKDIGEMEIPDETDFLERENCREIFRAVHKLEEPYREIILLRLNTDMKFSDIGDIFGKSEVWARVTFYRGKEKLKQLLEE